MGWFRNIFGKKNDISIIIDSLRGYKEYRKIITGNNIFRINNFKLLNGERISIVGDLNGIDFIFINRGEIGFIGENCGNDSELKKFITDECIVCYEDNIDIKYILCGHGMCKNCVESLMKKKLQDRKCPLCRRYIERVGNVISFTKEKAKKVF